MRGNGIKTAVLAGGMLLALLCQSAAAQQFGRRGEPQTGVYKARVEANWFGDNNRFWYRNELPGKTREFIVVDAEAGTREPAFDHRRLAAALSKAVTKAHEPDRLPFDTIEFIDDGKAIRFTAPATPGAATSNRINAFAPTRRRHDQRSGRTRKMKQTGPADGGGSAAGAPSGGATTMAASDAAGANRARPTASGPPA